MSLFSAAGAGLLFALGLALSGMTQPARVLGFLDVAGDWDPTLAFVMLGALAVYAPAYRVITRTRARPLAADAFHVPAKARVDARLLVGSAVFGVGWGLSGFCPGPVLVGMAAGAREAAWVTLAMVFGMLLSGFASRQRGAAGSRALSQP
jgi:uncharacterized membrane protein YedE/YeeE